jgi:hypothetical protein
MFSGSSLCIGVGVLDGCQAIVTFLLNSAWWKLGQKLLLKYYVGNEITFWAS